MLNITYFVLLSLVIFVHNTKTNSVIFGLSLVLHICLNSCNVVCIASE